MKLFRLLTTLAIIHLLTFSTVISAQDITEFEIRRIKPSLPFHSPSDLIHFDDQGQVLPVNQCSDYISPCPYQTRCGFIANDDDLIHLDPVNKAADIDLSPLSFECFESGCEFEYKNTADQIEKNLELISRIREEEANDAARDEARELINQVFLKASNVRELIEEQMGDYEFVPYYHPDNEAGLDPFVEAPVVTIENIKTLSNHWLAELNQVEILNAPVNWAEDTLLQLECDLCGTSIAIFAYNAMDEIAEAKRELELRAEIAQARNQAIMIHSLATILRSVGDSINGAADELVKISVKTVESASNRRKLRY